MTISFQGFTYTGWEDREEDNVKIFHDVLTPSGKTISMPLSPYCKVTQSHFEKWVLLNCPQERKIITHSNGNTISCNWNLQDIEEAFSKAKYI